MRGLTISQATSLRLAMVVRRSLARARAGRLGGPEHTVQGARSEGRLGGHSVLPGAARAYSLNSPLPSRNRFVGMHDANPRPHHARSVWILLLRTTPLSGHLPVRLTSSRKQQGTDRALLQPSWGGRGVPGLRRIGNCFRAVGTRGSDLSCSGLRPQSFLFP